MNSAVGPIFNEKVDKKCNLWVRKQCICALFTAESNRKVNNCGYCSLNSNRNTPNENSWKKKKRTKRNATWIKLNTNTHLVSTLKPPLHPQSVLSGMIFLLCDFFMWVCGFVPKLWLIWLFRVLLCLVPKKMQEKFIWNFVLRLVFVFVVYLEFQVMG